MSGGSCLFASRNCGKGRALATGRAQQFQLLIRVGLSDHSTLVNVPLLQSCSVSSLRFFITLILSLHLPIAIAQESGIAEAKQLSGEEREILEAAVAKPVSGDPVQIYGWRENVVIKGAQESVIAKLDTGHGLLGIELAGWQRIMEMAVICQEMTGLGYLGVDLMIDEIRGPMMIEVNARPGLAIQMANGIGLMKRLEPVVARHASHPEESVAEKIAFSCSMSCSRKSLPIQSGQHPERLLR